MVETPKYCSPSSTMDRFKQSIFARCQASSGGTRDAIIGNRTGRRWYYTVLYECRRIVTLVRYGLMLLPRLLLPREDVRVRNIVRFVDNPRDARFVFPLILRVLIFSWAVVPKSCPRGMTESCAHLAGVRSRQAGCRRRSAG